jgi:hypothetical protein
VPKPSPAALPAARVRLRARLHIHDHNITGAQISFRAPYAVTNADEHYSVSAYVCHGLSGGGTNADIARGATVTIAVGRVLAEACARSLRFTVEYDSFHDGRPSAPLGAITIHIPHGVRPAPLPQRVVELQRRLFPTRSLRAMVHLTLLPQTRAACDAAYLLHPCYKGEVEFVAPYAVGTAHYSVDGFAACKIGGRPETSWPLPHKIAAHQTIRTTSFGLFVRAPACASREGVRVTYVNPRAPSAGAPHESVIVGTVKLSQATLAP